MCLLFCLFTFVCLFCVACFVLLVVVGFVVVEEGKNVLVCVLALAVLVVVPHFWVVTRVVVVAEPHVVVVAVVPLETV